MKKIVYMKRKSNADAVIFYEIGSKNFLEISGFEMESTKLKEGELGDLFKTRVAPYFSEPGCTIEIRDLNETVLWTSN